eukprot:RCo005045
MCPVARLSGTEVMAGYPPRERMNCGLETASHHNSCQSRITIVTQLSQVVLEKRVHLLTETSPGSLNNPSMKITNPDGTFFVFHFGVNENEVLDRYVETVHAMNDLQIPQGGFGNLLLTIRRRGVDESNTPQVCQ